MDEPLLSSPNPRRFSGSEFLLNGEKETGTSISNHSVSDLVALKEKLIYGSARFPIIVEDDNEIDDLETASTRHNSFSEIPVTTPRRFSPLIDSLALDIKSDEIPKQVTDFPWDFRQTKRRRMHKSRTAPAMTTISTLENARSKSDVKSALPESVVRQAMMMLIVYLCFGVLIYHWAKDDFSGEETNSFVDALYFCIVTMCTIGYGDITPQSTTTKLLACLFVLVGFGFIDILLSGMVSLVLTKQEGLLLHAVEGGHHEIAETYLVDVKKGRMRIRMKVALALGVVVLCIGVGTAVMHSLEHLGWVDSFYLSVMSVTTVGYGDKAFKTLPGRLFASIWLLFSTLAVARSFLYLAEARIEKRHRFIAKWILQKELTVQDLIAADIDLNGFVSKSEFVVYKLKQMGRIDPKDIDEICKQFDRLDTDNCGNDLYSCLKIPERV